MNHSIPYLFRSRNYTSLSGRPAKGLLAMAIALAIGGVTFATPVTVTSFAPTPPNCDVAILPPTLLDELSIGTATPPDERISVTVSPSPPVCAVNPSGPSARFEMTNITVPGRFFTDVWYVASPGTTFDNWEMNVNGELAVKIDKVGAHSPLLVETLTPDGIFEPGEIWTFVLDGWRNAFGLPPAQMITPGIVGSTDFNASGSIIAVPIPEPSGLAAGGLLLAFASSLRRHLRRSILMA